MQAQPGKEWGSKHACCKACGLSIYSEKDDAEATRKRIPALRDTQVALARVTEESGLVAKTPSKSAKSHCTWWLNPDLEDAHTLLELGST